MVLYECISVLLSDISLYLLTDDETTTVDGQDPFAILTRANKYRSVNLHCYIGAQWLIGRVLDFKPRGCGFKPHQRHYVEF